MEDNAEKMIRLLSSDIDRKCVQIKEERNSKLCLRLFVLLCAAAVIVPAIFVAFGVSLFILIIPAAFMAVAFLLLSPIIIGQQGGHDYGEI